MNEVSSIGKFLEPLSEAYAHIPFEGYGIAGILSIVLLAFYGIVISRLKITERRKDSGQKSLCMVRDYFV